MALPFPKRDPTMLLLAGRYHSRGVITLLFDFVQDADPNIRAVAALSLAKTGACC